MTELVSLNFSIGDTVAVPTKGFAAKIVEFNVRSNLGIWYLTEIQGVKPIRQWVHESELKLIKTEN